MMRSMTAFAGSETEWQGWVIAAEIRAVNHRFLDLSVRLPETLRGLEADLRSLIGEYAKRGRIECSLTLRPTDQTTTTLKINPPLISALLEASKTIESMAASPLGPFSALDILKWPGALYQPETDREGLQKATLVMMREALQRLAEEREREGLQLGLLIKSRCELIQEEAGKARQRLPIVKDQLKEKLLSRLSDLAVSPDSDLLEQELVYLAQKMDVAEELDRLDLHLLEILKTLDQKEPAGRRLDFLIQELHREANTLGSKSGDIETSRHSVEIKVLIEQMREQVQNIE